MEKIRDAQLPETKKQLRSFLGLSGFYRQYCPNYATVAYPLTELTRSKSPNKIHWNLVAELAFKELKSRLVTKPILKLPEVDKEFVLRTDASNVGIGAVLLQYQDGELLPVAYASRKLLPRQQRYPVIELECLAIVWAVDRYKAYLFGRPFVLQTDHRALAYLNSATHTNDRVMRWAILLQPYDMVLEDIPGKENVGADFLSRLNSG